ncbi:MAG: transcriptional regulator [Rubritepida sp.]|nr:transcriptional regulator [Rubritepida sp.]
MAVRKLREPPVSADAADLALGVRLRQLREAKRISRRIVAVGLGVSPQQVEKYETGLTRLSVGRLLRFAAVLDVPPAALLMNLLAGAEPDSPSPDDPVFADACAAFAHLARIRQPGLRDAMLNVLSVLAGQQGRPGSPGVERTGKLAAEVPLETPGTADRKQSFLRDPVISSTKLYGVQGPRRYSVPEPEDTIS